MVEWASTHHLTAANLLPHPRGQHAFERLDAETSARAGLALVEAKHGALYLGYVLLEPIVRGREPGEEGGLRVEEAHVAGYAADHRIRAYLFGDPVQGIAMHNGIRVCTKDGFDAEELGEKYAKHHGGEEDVLLGPVRLDDADGVRNAWPLARSTHQLLDLCLGEHEQIFHGLVVRVLAITQLPIPLEIFHLLRQHDRKPKYLALGEHLKYCLAHQV